MFEFVGAFTQAGAIELRSIAEQWPGSVVRLFDCEPTRQEATGHILCLRVFPTSGGDLDAEQSYERLCDLVVRTQANSAVGIAAIWVECWGGECGAQGAVFQSGHMRLAAATPDLPYRSVLAKLMGAIGVVMPSTGLFTPLTREAFG